MRTFLPVVVVILLVLTGCAANPTVTDGKHRLVVATSVPGVMAGVGFGGTLGYDKAGCVVLGDAVLVAPPGSTLKDGVMTLNFGNAGKPSFKIGNTTDRLGGTQVGAFSQFVPTGTTCSSSKYFLLG